MKVQTIIILHILLISPIICPMPPSTVSQQQVAMGQTKYTELTQASSMPKYGPCWMKALSQLQSTCDQLNDRSHSRLALQFANCLLAQTGQKTYPCDPEEDVSKCLENVDPNAWTSYSNFYTHTHNICYFLKSQQWQELTDQTINKLSDTSSQTVEKLEQSQVIQEQIADGQRQSLEYHKQLVENGSVLSQAIENSRGSVKEMMEEFKLSTLEQRNMIFEVFDRVSRLQNLVVSEVSWLYTVVFYCFCLLVIYLVTATKRTADARLWLFLILTINFGVERLVINLSLPDERSSRTSSMDVDISDMINQRIWMVRNSAVFVSFMTLMMMAIRFKDYNLINNKLLEDIQKQNQELRRSMESFQIDNKNSYNRSKFSGNPYDNIDGLDHDKLRKMLDEDTGYKGDEDDDFSDNDSEDSFNSTRTDRTFNPEDFATAEGSRETTPTPRNDIDLATEVIDSRLVVSTPLKHHSGEIPQLSNYNDDLSQPSTSLQNVLERSISSVLNSSGYNLRPRSRASNSSMMSFNSTLSESPSKLQQQDVTKAQNILNRNKSKVGMIGRQNKTLSSSKTGNTPKKPAVKKIDLKTARGDEYSADED